MRWNLIISHYVDFCKAQACLEIGDLGRRLEVTFVRSLFSHSEARYIAVFHLEYDAANMDR